MFLINSFWVISFNHTTNGEDSHMKITAQIETLIRIHADMNFFEIMMSYVKL
jgi:hypothetical protein